MSKLPPAALGEVLQVVSLYGLSTQPGRDVQRFQTNLGRGGTTFVEHGARASQAAHAIADATGGALKVHVDAVAGSGSEKWRRLLAAYSILDEIGIDSE